MFRHEGTVKHTKGRLTHLPAPKELTHRAPSRYVDFHPAESYPRVARAGRFHVEASVVRYRIWIPGPAPYSRYRLGENLCLLYLD